MPDIWMDVDVALSEVPINLVPLIDDTDFKTREESVVYNQAGLDLLWNFMTTAGAFTQTAVTPTDTGGDYDFVNKGNGHYTIEIPASGGASINNDAEGFGYFSGFATGILPWRGPVIGFRAAGLNNLLIDSAHSATRGLSGTALPDAVADAAGGLPISDAGGLDIDTKLANTNEVTAARMGALTDWINGGRLDLILDIIAADTTTDIPALIAALENLSAAEAEAACDAALVTYDPPTKAEMDAAHALLATVAKQDVIDGIVDDILTDTGTTLENRQVTIATDAARLTAVRAAVLTDLIDGGRLDLLIDAIKAKTDNLPADPADDSDIDTQLATIAGYLDTEIAAILAEVDTEVAAIKSVTDNLADSATTIVSATVVADGGNSTTQFKTNLTEATNDHYNGRIVIFTSGNLQNQATDITDYDGTNKIITVTAMTETPAEDDTFVMI